MSTYPQRVAENLLPLSIADTVPSALNEWYFTEKTYDHEEPTEICQLCDQEEVRYHFEIANKYTKKTLWVGSTCILRFGVAVYEEGRKLNPKEARSKLHKLTQKMRLVSCLKALKRLADAEGTDILKNALVYYEKNKKLTPKQAFVVFWKLQDNHIDHSPSFFNISLRRSDHIEDLKHMPTQRVHRFWDALSLAQKEKALELGHYPPTSK